MYQHAPFIVFFLAGILPVLPDKTQFSKISSSSPPATIPAFPEQSDLSGCPLDLPDQLFHSIKSVCGGRQLHRRRCCPVLGAWLYSAYSTTALGRTAAHNVSAVMMPNELPVLPDDSETCVDGVSRALRRRRINLAKPNETCDLVYCYCGIRLHHLSCPEAFQVNDDGKLVGDENVRRLETDCFGNSDLGGCNRCLNALYKLNRKISSGASNTSEEENRSKKMRNKECELMGLTWLPAKNRTAYIRTVTSVLGTIMLNPDDASAGDGMPLAVDSSEFSHHSSSPFFNYSASHTLLTPQLHVCPTLPTVAPSDWPIKSKTSP